MCKLRGNSTEVEPSLYFYSISGLDADVATRSATLIWWIISADVYKNLILRSVRRQIASTNFSYVSFLSRTLPVATDWYPFSLYTGNRRIFLIVTVQSVQMHSFLSPSLGKFWIALSIALSLPCGNVCTRVTDPPMFLNGKEISCLSNITSGSVIVNRTIRKSFK